MTCSGELNRSTFNYKIQMLYFHNTSWEMKTHAAKSFYAPDLVGQLMLRYSTARTEP